MKKRAKNDKQKAKQSRSCMNIPETKKSMFISAISGIFKIDLFTIVTSPMRGSPVGSMRAGCSQDSRRQGQLTSPNPTIQSAPAKPSGGWFGRKRPPAVTGNVPMSAFWMTKKAPAKYSQMQSRSPLSATPSPEDDVRTEGPRMPLS